MRLFSLYPLAGLVALGCSSAQLPSEKRPVGSKVAPFSLSLEESPQPVEPAWKLFDRSTSQGWTPAENSPLVVQFGQETRLSALKVYGSAPYRLLVLDEEGKPLSGATFDLSSLGSGWHRLSFPPRSVESVTLQFVATGGEGELKELELWGEDPEGSLLGRRENLLEVLSQDASLWPSSLVSVGGVPSEVFLQNNELGDGCAEISFEMSQSPRLYPEAYLSFEAWGLLRASSLEILVNGSTASEGVWIAPGRTDRAQAFLLPLDPEKLTLGQNQVEVCLPSLATSGVTLSSPRLVGLVETGRDWIDATTQGLLPLTDENALTTTEVNEELVLPLRRFLAPSEVYVELTSPTARIRSIDCQEGLSWKELASETLFRRGQHQIPVSGGELSCRSLRIKVEGKVQFSKIEVIGSGAKERRDWPGLTLLSAEALGGTAVLQGFFSAPGGVSGPIPVKVSGAPVDQLTGRFSELLFPSPQQAAPWKVELSASFANQQSLTQVVTIEDHTEDLIDALTHQELEGSLTPRDTVYGEPGEAIEKAVSDTETTEIFLGDKVGISVPAGAMKNTRVARSIGQAQTIQVEHLQPYEIPPLDPMLINVTAPNRHAYEFTPHGTTFAPAASVTLPYDVALLPEGATVEDIKTYFYDPEMKRWEALPKLEVDVGLETVLSETTHFTIMINGVLTMPENPSVSSLTPTEISSLAAADPGAGMDMIQPPSANSSGDANLSYPLWLPPGRGGFSPSLGLSYSSGGGNGWLGQGWDLRISRIEIDTRFGVPTYSNGEEPRYLLDGEQLVDAPLEQDGPNCSTGGIQRRYRPRVEETFYYILRCGNSPTQPIPAAEDTATYHWEVLDRSGTRYFYGTSIHSRLASYRERQPGAGRGGVFSWHLDKVKDIDNNVTTFEYFIDKKPGSEPGEDWRQIYPESIHYTAHEDPTLEAQYHIEFILNDRPADNIREDIMISARPGFKTLTRYLLRAVRVRFGSELVRQYLLTYHKSTHFKKTLLKKIEVHGANDENTEAPCFSYDAFVDTSCPSGSPNFFYEHAFEYNQEFLGFEDPVRWDVTGNPDQEKSGLTGSLAISGDVNFYGGLSPFPKKSPSIGLELSVGGGGRQERVGFYDINGDNLPDEIYRSSNGLSVLYNQYVASPDGTPNCNQGTCAFNTEIPIGDFRNEVPPEASTISVYGLSKLGLDLDFRLSGGVRFFGLDTNFLDLELGVSAGRDRSKSSRFMTDLNGDGMIDQVRKGSVLLGRRHIQDESCPYEKVCFVPHPYNAAEGAEVEEEPEDAAALEMIERYRLQTDAVRKWVAPFAGEVEVTATVQRFDTRISLGDGSRVQLFRYRPDQDPSDSQLGGDLQSLCPMECPLEIAGNDATEYQIGDTIEVAVGDEIYLLAGSNLESDYGVERSLDELQTSLTITYQTACREVFNEPDCIEQTLTTNDYEMYEPTGSKTYVFDSAQDFKLAGGAPIPFIVPQGGTLVLNSTFGWAPSSDDIRFCVQRFPKPEVDAQGNILPIGFTTDLPCDVDVPFDHNSNAPGPSFYTLEYFSGNLTSAGGSLNKQIELEDLLPGELIVFRVESDFPIDPNAVQWDIQGQYTEVCEPDGTNCSLLCELSSPGCNPILGQTKNLLFFDTSKFTPFFPQPQLVLAEPRDVLVIPEDGSIRVTSLIYSNIPGQPLPPLIFAIRREHELLDKQLISSPYYDAGYFDVSAGDSISFDYLAEDDTDVLTIIRWEPLVNGDGIDNIQAPTHGYLLPQPKNYSRNTRGEYIDIFEGGFHGWFYGAWNSEEPFNPNALQLPFDLLAISDEVLARVFLKDPPPPSAPPFEQHAYEFFSELHNLAFPMVPSQTGNFLSDQSPFWFGPDGSTFVTQTTMNGGKTGESVFSAPPSAVLPQEIAEDVEPGDNLNPDSFLGADGAVRKSVSTTYTLYRNLSLEGTNLSFNGSVGTGNTRAKVEAIDINGDGILDSVRKGEWSRGTLPVEGVLPPVPPPPPWVQADPVLEEDGLGKTKTHNFSKTFGVGAEAPGALYNLVNSAKRLMGVATSSSGSGLSGGGSLSIARSRTELELQDVNGDGLPDLVSRDTTGVKVKLNLGGTFSAVEETFDAAVWPYPRVDEYRGVNEETLDGSAAWRHDSSQTLNISVGFNGAISEMVGLGANIGFNSSMTRTTVSTADMNGDGLVDLVFKKDGATMFVQFNKGNSFTDPTPWSAAPWGTQLLPENTVPSVILADLGLPSALAALLPDGIEAILAKLAGPDVISGTGFYSSTKPLGLNVSASYTKIVPIFLILYGILDFGASASIQTDTYELTLVDIDGDGAPDHVLRRAAIVSPNENEDNIRDGGQLWVKHNKTSGKENLLKTVHGPLKSKIHLEYQRTQNTVLNPHSRMVLSKVTVDDDHEFSDPAFSSPDLVHEFSYENGFYDRSEKEFFGFEVVTTTIKNGALVHQTLRQEVNNRDYALKGKPTFSIRKDGQGNTLDSTAIQYDVETIYPAPSTSDCFTKRHPLLGTNSCDVVFPHPTIQTSIVHEGTQFKTHIQEDLNYDIEFGNLRSSRDHADDSTPTDDVFAGVRYKNETSKWLIGLPEEIIVCSQQVTVGTNGEIGCPGTLLRKRSAQYDPLTGNLETLTVQLDENGTVASTTFEYDEFGNLSRVNLPPNEAYTPSSGDTCPTLPNNNPQYTEYTYDLETRQFIVRVENGFGLYSEAEYNKKFGVVTETTDANLQVMTKTYDDFGRLTSVRGPYDTGALPALELFYYPIERRAVTKHHTAPPPNYDPSRFAAQGGNFELDTVTIVDGVGRPIQVRKTAVIEDHNEPVIGMVAQKPPKYDNLGRVVQSYHPFFIESTSLTGLVTPPAPDPQTEVTITAYDEKDRVESVTYPDGSISSASYAIALFDNKKRFITTSTDENGHIRKSVTDGVGRSVAVIEPDLEGPGTGAITRYTHFRTGELETITDDDGNVTTLEYDFRGLWTSMDNPDTGLIEQFYDKNGNLRKRIEPNHRANNAAIEYHYEKNRLFCVDYPTKQDVVYEYGAASEAQSGNTTTGLAGRLKHLTDETGTQRFTYGALGEIREVRRDINEQQLGSSSPLQDQVMKMFYDGFGRLLSMTYPDGERLFYSYDPAGQLIAMQGEYGPNDPIKHYLKDVHYDKFGNKVSAVLGNNVKSTWTFEPKRLRLQTATTALPNAQGEPGAGQKIQDLQYDYDDVGNPTDITSQLTTPGNNEIRAGAGNWHFDYDNADRLLFATACHSTQPQESTSYQQNFEYTKIHNIRDKRRRHKIYSNSETCNSGPFEAPEANNFDLDYEYDPQRPHRVTEVGGLNFQYDASGNLLQKGEDEFEWDDDNHLIYSRTNHKVWNYYDAAGLRVIKKSADFGTTLFISQYFDARLVENENSASKHFFAGGTRIASEIIEYNPEIEGDPSQATGSEGRAYFFVQDHLGSSGFLLSESAQVVEHLEYFADGDVWIDQNDEAPINGYKFTGKFFDPETGFYDHGQRFYDPKTSLWISIDPLGTETPGSMVGRPMVASLYGYAALSPLRFIDPDGRDPRTQDRSPFNFNEERKKLEKTYGSKEAAGFFGSIYYYNLQKYKGDAYSKSYIGYIVSLTNLNYSSMLFNHYLKGSGSDVNLNLENLKNYSPRIKNAINSAYESNVNEIKDQTLDLVKNGISNGTFSYYGYKEAINFTGEFSVDNDIDMFNAMNSATYQGTAAVSFSQDEDYIYLDVEWTFTLYDIYRFHTGRNSFCLDDQNCAIDQTMLKDMHYYGIAREFLVHGNLKRNYKLKINKKTNEIENQ